MIFFARYEASQFGSPYIESEHFSLGLLRADKGLCKRIPRSHAPIESIREAVPTSDGPVTLDWSEAASR